MRLANRLVVVGMLLALVACGSSSSSGGGGGGGGTGPSFGDLTVTFSVRNLFGSPVGSIPLWIAGRGPFITDASGKVVVTQVPVPYTVVAVDGTDSSADVFVNLTRPDPVLTVSRLDSAFLTSFAVSGTVSGGATYPLPMMHDSQVTVAFQNAVGGDSDSPDTLTGMYDLMEVSWLPTGSSPTAELVAYQYMEDANGDPMTFTGWGTLPLDPIPLTGSLTMQDIPLGPVATTSASGMVDGPGVLGTFAWPLLTLPSGGLIFLQPSGPGLSPLFEAKFPVVPGSSRALLLGTITGGSGAFGGVFQVLTDLPAPATGLVIPDIPDTELVLPFDGITGVGYETNFYLSPNPGERVFEVTFAPVSPSPGPTIVLHTAQDIVRIPDLGWLGLPIPSGSTYRWEASFRGPYASEDEGAVPEGTPIFIFPVTLIDGTYFGSSDEFQFTFGP